MKRPKPDVAAAEIVCDACGHWNSAGRRRRARPKALSGTLQEVRRQGTDNGHRSTCIAEVSESPLSASHRWHEKASAITAQVQSRHPGFGWHAAKLVVAQCEWKHNRTVNA
jgi:hypothetical protein